MRPSNSLGTNGAFVGVLATFTVVALSACSDSMGIAAGSRAQISFTTAASTGQPSSASFSRDVIVTVGAHTVAVQQVQLDVDRTELKPVTRGACAGDDDDENDDHDRGSGDRVSSCAEVKLPARTIDLPLNGGLVTLDAGVIPAGTFRELEFRISQVRLRGTFDGQTFDVTLPVRAHVEAEFSTPLVVTATTTTQVTVNVPVATWLVNNDGSVIDPRQLATNASLQAAVRNRIRASFRAFEDRDHDGREDHDR